MSISSRYEKIIFYTAILFFLTLLYGQLLPHYQLIHGDDFFITLPLSKIHSPFEYLTALVNFQLIDIQPVRDLSYFFDMWLIPYCGFRIFLITNLVIWFLSIIQLKKLLLRFNNSNVFCSLFALIMAIYPTFSWVISSASSRKHLLSFLFGLLFINLIFEERNNKNYIKMIVTFILSVFSNPITVIIWIPSLIYDIVYGNKDAKNLRKFYFIIIFLSALVFILNYYYYNTLVPSQSDGAQTLQNWDINLTIMALGRFFFQILAPIHFSSYYNQVNLENFIGLLGLAFVLFTFYFISSKKEFIFILSLYFCNLLIPLLRVSHNLISDSYLLLPFVAYLIIILKIFSLIQHKLKKSSYIILSIGLIACFYKTNFEIHFWTDPTLLTRISFTREKNCRNLQPYFMNLILNDNLLEVNQNSGVLFDSCPKMFGPTLFSILIYTLDGTTNEKLKKLHLIDNISASLVSELIKLENNEPNNFENTMKESKLKITSGFRNIFFIFIDNRRKSLCRQRKVECDQI